MSAVWIARVRSDVYRTSGTMPDPAMSSPARFASFSPSSLSRTSTQPVNRFFWFQSLLP